MPFQSFQLCLIACFLLRFALTACSQERTSFKETVNSELHSKQRLRELTFTTLAYEKEVLRLVIEEANRVAQELRLQEDLPIRETNLVAAYISPPRMAQNMKTTGNVTTSNYIYYVSVGNKFSFLVRRNLEREYDQLRKQYYWPITHMDTNAAFQLAAKFLASVSMDVEALNRDCKVHILAHTPEGNSGKYFVPLYWVYWVAKGQEGRGSVASVEFVQPTKTIRQLHVNESKYILRKPLVITNLDFLLSQTNSPAITSPALTR